MSILLDISDNLTTMRKDVRTTGNLLSIVNAQREEKNKTFEKEKAEITTKRAVLTTSIAGTQAKLNKNIEEKKTVTTSLEQQKEKKITQMETLKANEQYLPTKITNKISKIENEDKKKI